MSITKYIIALLLLLAAHTTYAQYTIKAVVKDKEGVRLPGVIGADTHGHGNASNDSGIVIITGLPEGADTFYFTFVGYDTTSLAITIPDNGKIHEVTLNANESELEEAVVVSSTRTNDRIENSPTKVEVLGLEEMTEENTIKPANIVGILGDVSGVQLQQSSPISGNTNVRIQGLNGQYTQILRDGMPLYEGFSGGFGVLQIPPLDLRQIELIKGSSSTLYGGGAIAGLINLISKRPKEEQEAVFTVNATTLKEQDVNAYLAKRNTHFGYTFFAGYTHQDAVDVNGDGLSDVPNLSTFTIHPRLFWYPNDKTTLIVGYSGTFEQRYGGDMQVLNDHADSLHQYYEKDITQRHTGELILERTLPKLGKLTVKGSASSFNRDIETNTDDIKGNEVNYYGEVSLFIPQKASSLVVGVNVTGDNFTKLPGTDSLALGNFTNNTIGAFAQYSWHIATNTTLEGGLRGDHTNSYGDFILPRLTFFHRFNETWATRAGVGLGYKTPNPLESQIIDYPTQDIQALPANIKAEKSTGYNLEGNFKKDLGNGTDLFVNHAFFFTQINDPVIATQAANGQVFFTNAGSVVNTMGFDTYVKLTIKKIELYVGYTYTDAERKYLAPNQFMPLTPRNRFAFTAARAFGKNWRVGLEGSYIGTQYRDGDSNTPAYYLTALMIERKLGKVFTLVVNGENLFDYRQTKYEQIYTGSITDPTFKPLWGPTEGRVINFSLRITPKFGSKKEKDND
jgi:iron complex outermembrane receptor protein/outer membrane receptor for ferrienterochelin and colicins